MSARRLVLSLGVAVILIQTIPHCTSIKATYKEKKCVCSGDLEGGRFKASCKRRGSNSCIYSTDENIEECPWLDEDDLMEKFGRNACGKGCGAPKSISTRLCPAQTVRLNRIEDDVNSGE